MNCQPNIRRIIKKRYRPNLDIRNRPGLCIRPNEISARNKQTLQLRNHRRKNQWILPFPKRILRPSRHTHNIPREDRPYARTRNTRMARRYHSGHTGHKRKTHPKIRISTHKTRKRRLQGEQEKVKILLKRDSLLGHTIAQDGRRPNKEKTEAINKLNPPTNTKTLKSFLGAIQYVANFIPNLSEKTDNMRQLFKKNTKWEWTEERNTDFNKIKKELTSQPCLAHYNGNKENIVTTDACGTGLGIALWQKQSNGDLKPIAFASRYLNDAEKKYSVGELELLAVVWGLERFRFHLYGKQVQLFSDHQALEPLLKKNKSNKQYSAQLTRWLDILNHFDITLKYTAGKEIKFTDFISRNPTEIVEPEENYEEEFVINAIAQLATANYRIGRIFNQSNHSNTAVMHDTRRIQTGTRCSKTNNHSNFQTTANYINHTVTDNYHLKLEKNQTLDNNNNEDTQEPKRYPRDEEGRLKYHWGADDTIMKIIKRRDNLPETKDLV